MRQSALPETANRWAADGTGIRRKSGLRYRRVTRIKNARRTREREPECAAPFRRFFPLVLSLFTAEQNKSIRLSVSVRLSFSLSLSPSRAVHLFLSFERSYTPDWSLARSRTIYRKKKQYGLTLPRNRIVENTRFHAEVDVGVFGREAGTRVDACITVIIARCKFEGLSLSSYLENAKDSKMTFRRMSSTNPSSFATDFRSRIFSFNFIAKFMFALSEIHVVPLIYSYFSLTILIATQRSDSTPYFDAHLRASALNGEPLVGSCKLR